MAPDCRAICHVAKANRFDVSIDVLFQARPDSRCANWAAVRPQETLQETLRPTPSVCVTPMAVTACSGIQRQSWGRSLSHAGKPRPSRAEHPDRAAAALAKAGELGALAHSTPTTNRTDFI